MSNINSILESILDNTAGPEKFWEQGILKFGKTFLPDYFGSPFSVLHYEMTRLLFELMNPRRERRIERQAYFLVHREAAKSTIGSFLFPLYLIYLKGMQPYVRVYKADWEGGSGVNTYDIVKLPPINENFIVIVSETATQSELFVSDIKEVIDLRSDLAEIFGEKHPELVSFDDDRRKRSKQWTRNAFVTSDNTVVYGIGTSQRIRGRKVRGKRPSLVIVDDMYSEENIKTEERRSNIDRWFFNGLLNSLDSEEGKLLWLGTMVHPDIVVKKFIPSKDWFGMERPIISQKELNEGIQFCTKDGNFEVPKRQVLMKEQRNYKTLSWPTRHDLHYVLSLYFNQLQRNDLDYFYQEYMNMTIAPETKILGEDAFLQLDILYQTQDGRPTVEFQWQNRTWVGSVELNIGIDIASSLSKASDDTVICVAGYCRVYPHFAGTDHESSRASMPKGLIMPIIVHIEGGKYDIHAQHGRKGICEAVESLVRRFGINRIVAEANGQQEQIVREIEYHLQDKGLFIQVIPEYVNTSKAERIMSILLPLAQRYKHFICYKSPLINKLYLQLLSLGVADRDDYPDALEECYKYIHPPGEWSPNDSQYESNTMSFQELYHAHPEDAWQFL